MLHLQWLFLVSLPFHKNQLPAWWKSEAYVFKWDKYLKETHLKQMVIN